MQLQRDYRTVTAVTMAYLVAVLSVLCRTRICGLQGACYLWGAGWMDIYWISMDYLLDKQLSPTPADILDQHVAMLDSTAAKTTGVHSTFGSEAT